jgi:hypothetical protein
MRTTSETNRQAAFSCVQHLKLIDKRPTFLGNRCRAVVSFFMTRCAEALGYFYFYSWCRHAAGTVMAWAVIHAATWAMRMLKTKDRYSCSLSYGCAWTWTVSILRLERRLLHPRTSQHLLVMSTFDAPRQELAGPHAAVTNVAKCECERDCSSRFCAAAAAG